MFPDSVLIYIAAAQAKAEDLETALQTADIYPPEGMRDMAIRAVAEAQARGGDRAGALKTLDRIKLKENRQWAVARVAAALLLAGRPTDAQTALQQISQAGSLEGFFALTGWVEVGQAQARTGDLRGAV
jgi:hypothetical protein